MDSQHYIIANNRNFLVKEFKGRTARKKAIKFALEEMESREGKNIMLLAGKGHENYQLIGPDKNYFDDKKTVISLLKKQKNIF